MQKYSIEPELLVSLFRFLHINIYTSIFAYENGGFPKDDALVLRPNLVYFESISVASLLCCKIART